MWEQDGHQVGFWLEHDTGTETIGRLIDKIDPYRRLRRDGGPDHPLLFHLPGPARAADLHRRIAEHLVATPAGSLGIVVATATHADHPAGQVWAIVGQEHGRRRLADLPSQSGRPGPYHPGPPTPEQTPAPARHHPGPARMSALLTLTLAALEVPAGTR